MVLDQTGLQQIRFDCTQWSSSSSLDGTVALLSNSTALHTVGIDTRGLVAGKFAASCSLATIKVHVFDVERVDVTREV